MGIPQTKICKGCHIDKPLPEYGKHKHGLYGLRSRCRHCRKLGAAERNRDPVTRAKTKITRRIWKEKNKKHLATKQLERHYADPERARTISSRWVNANREHCRTISREYAKTHQAERSALQNARRAKQLERTPPWVNLKKIKSWYIQASKLGLQVDHIIPLQGKLVSGLHVHNNLQLLTPLENQQKKNKFEVVV